MARRSLITISGSMAYREEKNGAKKDIVISGYENGMMPSPHKGIAMIKNANLSTETGEVIPSFPRVQQSMTDTSATGTLTFLDSSHVNLSIPNANSYFKGQWITVTNSSHAGELPNGTYYVPFSTGSGYELYNYYNVSQTASPVSVDVLVVGAGGGGGGNALVGSNTVSPGGGGAGQVLSISADPIKIGTYPVVVGTGGAGGTTTSSPGGNGTSSSFNSHIGEGGGGGGAKSHQNGATGGSGGGAEGDSSTTGFSAGTGGSSGGGTNENAGGNGAGRTDGAGGNSAGGGGGGADAAGTAGTVSGVNSTGGNGGAGISSSITGSAVTYGGGGAGDAQVSTGVATPGTGGVGGGGNVGVAGTDGLGGGGGARANGGKGVVIISYTTGACTATGGTITTSGGKTIHTFTSDGNFQVTAIPLTPAPTQQVTGFTTGLTATIQLTAPMGKPISKATETYYRNGTPYNRYYILDSTNIVHVYDTYYDTIYSSTDNCAWFIPDYKTNWCTQADSISVISGFLCASTTTGMFGKSVAMLGGTNTQNTTWTQFDSFNLWQGGSQSNPHFTYVGHQGYMYITDGNYVVSVFPDCTIADSASPIACTQDNVQSQCSWVVGGGSTEGIPTVISGTNIATSDGKRLPAVFFSAGTLPDSITAGTVYYVSGNANLFEVFSASTGGSALDLSTGAAGTQYFNTFYPVASASGYAGSTPTYVLSGQRCTLPSFEIAQTMTEIGNYIILGCQGNAIYPWDQVSNLPSVPIYLPEANVVNILTVNQMAYLFAGNKGNIYITDGSVASLVCKVPDYAAGIPGTPNSYIEPFFVWGDSAYIRGKIYFSLLDQTATKVGNCGGIWSFTPTQNFYIGQDIGLGMHIENINSYNTYSGYTTIILPKVDQEAIAPQFWTGWESDITSPVYGIDTTGTTLSSSFTTILETDFIPIGTQLQKFTPEQIEQKFATALASTDTVTVNYRQDLTAAWASCGTPVVDPSKLSTYFISPTQQIQWLQLQVVITPTTSGNFPRFTEQRIR